MAEPVAILPLSGLYAEAARQLGAELGLSVLPPPVALRPTPELKSLLLSDDHPYLLLVDGSGLSLHQTGKKAAGPLQINFETQFLHYQNQSESLQKRMIARAVGVKGQRMPTVIDATAGLGEDSFLLASLGCQVRMLERVPVVHALLQDGLRRACLSLNTGVSDTIHRVQLDRVDARQYLQLLASEDYPDVLYLDPMFPDKRNKALPKKEMQYFHDLVGDDLDSSELLQIGLQCVRNRVVVKRPRQGSLLAGRKPSHSLMGTSIRYDVYMVTQAASCT